MHFCHVLLDLKRIHLPPGFFKNKDLNFPKTTKTLAMVHNHNKWTKNGDEPLKQNTKNLLFLIEETTQGNNIYPTLVDFSLWLIIKYY